MWQYQNTDELYHHGILGQKWGIRRTPEQLGYKDKIVIKKGTVAQRLTSKKDEKNTGHTYISYKKLDNLKYLSVADEGLGNLYSAESPNGYKVKLKITNDLVAPTYKERIDAFVQSTLKNDIKSVANETYKREYHNKAESREANKKAKEFIKGFNNKKTKLLLEDAYKDFAASLMTSSKNREMFFNELKNRGYNAVVDDNDSKFVETPIIVFERNKTLKQISATKIDYNKDILGSDYKLTQYLKKKKEKIGG